MDEFSKTLIAAVAGAGLIVLGGIITKALDFWWSILNQKREFKKYRREKAYEEIEELKNQLGTIYELSTNWNTYEVKLGGYTTFFAKDYELIGRYNKYPDIAGTARDTVYWCKVVASDERKRVELLQKGLEYGHLDQILKQNLQTLSEQYRAFVQACDKHIQTLV